MPPHPRLSRAFLRPGREVAEQRLEARSTGAPTPAGRPERRYPRANSAGTSHQTSLRLPPVAFTHFIAELPTCATRLALHVIAWTKTSNLMNNTMRSPARRDRRTTDDHATGLGLITPILESQRPRSRC